MDKTMLPRKALHILIILIALGLCLYLISGKPYPSVFEGTDISSQIKTKREGDFTGALLVNLDDDPDLEVFIAGHGNSNLLLERKGLEFYPIEIPELSDKEEFTFAALACDVDQDGRDELLLLNRPSTKGISFDSHLMKYEQGKWNNILLSDEIIKALQDGYGSSCIDRKGQGKYGIVVTKEDGTISFLEMVDSEIKDIAQEIGLSLKSKGRGVLGVPAPLGQTNIFVGNEEGPNFYFVNKGDGTFEEKAKEYGVEDSNFNARGIGHIDLNSDSIPDLVYGNSLGPMRLLEQTREGKFHDVTPESMTKEYAVNAPVAGDFNLDGYEDLYLNNNRGLNDLFGRYEDKWYRLNVKVMDEKEMYGISTIAGDLDNNGSYEILNTHGGGKKFPVKLYSIKPVSHWIRFDIRYENGGLPRGAIVVLRTNSREQVRVISTGSGRFANYDHAVTFGLLKEERVLSSEIILPSKQRLENTSQIEVGKVNYIKVPMRMD